MLHTNTISALEAYTNRYPDENIKDIISFVRTDPTSVQRSNQQRHVTASGLVLADDKILLVFHNKLERLIQPGGHLEETDASLHEAALREVYEETGLEVVPSPLFPHDSPVHVDAHIIPANSKRNEPEHWHYDCMYVFTAPNAEVRIDENEVSQYQWVPLNYGFADKGLAGAVVKIDELM